MGVLTVLLTAGALPRIKRRVVQPSFRKILMDRMVSVISWPILTSRLGF